jgi:hypothetical protein
VSRRTLNPLLLWHSWCGTETVKEIFCYTFDKFILHIYFYSCWKQWSLRCLAALERN